MARVKLSEYQAKSLISDKLNLPFNALAATPRTTVSQITKAFPKKSLVVKVDQGVKKRGLLGLLKLKTTPSSAHDFIVQKAKLGYDSFIIENLLPHEKSQEHYLSLERVREGVRVIYSPRGGMDVEEAWDSVLQWTEPGPRPSLPPQISRLLDRLIPVFDDYYLSFLEINPLVIKDGNFHLLDLAVEIDDSALQLPPLSSLSLKPVQPLNISTAELRVQDLDATTPASLKLKILQPDGSIWMLLSGGGASLVLADEIADLGLGEHLANYGEYSGNPTAEDTYLYTKIILEQLLKSKSSQKVLIIAGGVANFTDVAKTFKGVIQALDELKKELQKQNVLVFVRRGGPNQEKGLSLMSDFLKQNNLFGYVEGPDHELTEVAKVAIAHLQQGRVK